MSGAIPLTKTQINKIYNKIDLMQDKETKKAAFAITHAGLRVTETALLEIKDVLYPSGKIRVEVFLPSKICKNLKPRTVWFANEKVRQAIQESIDYRLKKRWGTSLHSTDYQGLIPESRLLYNNRGRPFAIGVKKRALADGSVKDYRACSSLQTMIQGIYNRCGHKDASSLPGVNHWRRMQRQKASVSKI